MKQKMMFTKMSPFSKKTNSLTLDVDPADIARWQNGELIQNALPYLNAAEREFLMTGIMDDEWNQMFPPEVQEADQEQEHQRGIQMTEQETVVHILTEFTELMEVHEELIANMITLLRNNALTWENIKDVRDVKARLDKLMTEMMAIISNWTSYPSL